MKRYLFLVVFLTLFTNFFTNYLPVKAETFKITNYFLSGWSKAYSTNGNTLKCAAHITIENNIPEADKDNYVYIKYIDDESHGGTKSYKTELKYSYFEPNQTVTLKAVLVSSDRSTIYDEITITVTSDETCGPETIEPPTPVEPTEDEEGGLPPGVDWGAIDDTKPKNACGNGQWTSPLRNWVDNIFCPVIAFLDLAKQKLDETSTIMGQGLDIGKYFSIFGDLPTSWQLVVSSLLLMVTTLSGLIIFRSAMRLYYAIKEGVKWW